METTDLMFQSFSMLVGAILGSLMMLCCVRKKWLCLAISIIIEIVYMILIVCYYKNL